MNEWGETVMTLSVLGSVMGEKILLFMEKKENLYFHLLHINFVSSVVLFTRRPVNSKFTLVVLNL